MIISNGIKFSTRIKSLFFGVLVFAQFLVLYSMKEDKVREYRIQLFNKKIESQSSLDCRSSFCGVGCGFMGSFLCCLIQSDWWTWGGTCGVLLGLSVPIIHEAVDSIFGDFTSNIPDENLLCAGAVISHYMIDENFLGKLSEAKSLLLLNNYMKKTFNIKLPKQIVLKILKHVITTERGLYLWWKQLSEENKNEINKKACEDRQLNAFVGIMNNIAVLESVFRKGKIGLENPGGNRLPFSPCYFEKMDIVFGGIKGPSRMRIYGDIMSLEETQDIMSSYAFEKDPEYNK